MTQRLIHYSQNPIALADLKQRRYIGKWDEIGKTDGLWVSVHGDDDWWEWCQSEGFRLDRLSSASEVILKPDASILRLSSPRQIDSFTSKYAATEKISPSLGQIDWKAVRAKYSGLIIAPYCYERRLSRHTFWYYGWDCASGVIWDLSAIAEIKPFVETRTLKLKEETA